MHVFSAATHLFARLDTSPSRDDAGFIALPTRDEGLCPRLFGLSPKLVERAAELDRRAEELAARAKSPI